MPTALPDDVWLKIWQMVAPTPPEMGELRRTSRQMCHVLDDDVLWPAFSPRALAQGQPLRDAFMDRVAGRSARGNRALAQVYRGTLVPQYMHDPTDRTPETVCRRFQRGGAGGERIYERELTPYLRLGALGRDDDFDAASAPRAPSVFWRVFTTTLRNDTAVLGPAVARRGKVLAYAGVGALTPALLRSGLAQHGDVIADLPTSVRRHPDYALLAVGSGAAAYRALHAELQADRRIAELHVACHPYHAEETHRYFGDELAFYTKEFLIGLYDSRDYLERVRPSLHKNRLFLRRLVACNPFSLRWCADVMALANDPQFVQSAWRIASRDEREVIRLFVNVRLQRRWSHINTEKFLNPATAEDVNFSLREFLQLKIDDATL